MPLCEDARVEVIVEGTTIPTVNEGVTTEVTSDAQKSGADITRISEVYLPIEWKEENITSKIQSFDPSSQGHYDRVTIRWQSVRGGEWTPVHRGFVRGVSGAADMGVAKMIVSDPAAMTTAVPFSKYYEKPTALQVFNDVADTLRENTPFNPQVRGSPTSRQLDGGGGGSSGAIDAGSEIIGAVLGVATGTGEFGESTISGVAGNIPDTTAFQSNRHSCADALNWACNLTGGKWYFEFRSSGSSGLSLIYDNGSNAVTFAQRTGHGAPIEQRLNDGGSLPNAADSELDIIKNDALAQMFPINTLTVKGATGVSLFGFETSMLPSEKAPYVTVEYPPLVQRAGGNVVSDTIETDNVTLESAENRARKELESRILDSGTGTILCYGNGHPKPYDFVVSKPECADVLTTSVDSLPYEIASVTHKKTAWEEATTEISVSPVVSPSAIVVKEAEMRDV